MLIIVIKKSFLDPPFNSASVMLSGRLRVSAAKETFPFRSFPASLGNRETSRDKMFHHFLELWMDHSRQGEYRGVIFQGLSGIRFSTIISPLCHSHHLFSFISLALSAPSSPRLPAVLRNSLKTGTSWNKTDPQLTCYEKTFRNFLCMSEINRESPFLLGP